MLKINRKMSGFVRDIPANLSELNQAQEPSTDSEPPDLDKGHLLDREIRLEGQQKRTSEDSPNLFTTFMVELDKAVYLVKVCTMHAVVFIFLTFIKQI